jgi:hypothetical protein
MYVEWDDGDKKVVAVYIVTKTSEEKPWMDFNGDNKPDSSPAALEYEDTIEDFPQGLKINTPEDAKAAAKDYSERNPGEDIPTVKSLTSAVATTGLIKVKGEQLLVQAAGGDIKKARPDFYAGDSGSAKKAVTQQSASPSATSASSTSAGSGSGVSVGSASPTPLRVKKGEYGFFFKFSNTSKDPITVFIYLLDRAAGETLGAPINKFVQGPDRATLDDASYIGKIVTKPGEKISENIFGREDLKQAASNKPSKEYIFFRFYRGAPGNNNAVDWKKTVGTSLSKLYGE